jgi:DNA repair ATPase RecN
MEKEIIEIILRKYEGAIATYVKYKERIQRHENELKKSNQQIQLLKAEIEVLKCKLETNK